MTCNVCYEKEKKKRLKEEWLHKNVKDNVKEKCENISKFLKNKIPLKFKKIKR